MVSVLNKQAIAVCEVLGGFVDNDKCIFWEIHLSKAQFDCEKPPLFGEITHRFMTNEESLQTLGVKHKVGKANYTVCVVPIDNLMNISYKSRDILANNASYRVQQRIERRKFWATASEEEKEAERKKQRDWYDLLSVGKKQELAIRKAEQMKQSLLSLPSEEKEERIIKKIKRDKERYDSLSSEEKEERLAKMSERSKEWYDSLSRKEKEEYNARKSESARKRRALWSPEERAEHLAKAKQYNKIYYSEKREEILSKNKEWYDSLSRKEKKQRNAYQRKLYALMPPEKKELLHAKHREYDKEYRAKNKKNPPMGTP